MAGSVAQEILLPIKALQSFQHFSQETDDIRHELEIRVKALRDLVGYAVNPAPETPMNGQLGPHRRFDWLTMSLDDVKLVRKALGCTVNDVVLTTVTGAIRDFMIRRLVRPEGSTRNPPPVC